MKDKIRIIVFLLLLITLFNCADKKEYLPIKLRFENNETVTYQEAIKFYRQLDDQFSKAKLMTYRYTDIGEPLHLFVISGNGDFNPVSIKKSNKRIILINNGIHPGEPCGIDASIKFSRDILSNENNLNHILDNTVICIIPVFNIGGSLNRSEYHRVNDTSVEATGFRGNARHLDLNRDFSKADSKNTLAFYEIFQEWDPDIFIDTHETNGSDHQYVLTLIHPQPDCMHPALKQLYNQDMKPYLFDKMKKSGYEMTPYIKIKGEDVKPHEELDPKDGLLSWAASPRFTNGYSLLFNTISFVTENHVYKGFKDRVLSVYHFMIHIARYTNKNSQVIKDSRDLAKLDARKQKEFVVSWEQDYSKFEKILFKGYEKKIKASKLSDNDKYYYDKNDPYEDTILFFDNYKPLTKVTRPEYYIIPKQWRHVIERLKMNKVKMDQLSVDTSLLVNCYYISSYTSFNYPYSGHYYHNSVELQDTMQKIKFCKGDYIIKMDQERNRYVVEMLEPKAIDSFFKWNFFDSCLEQKEYYSDFAFEDVALQLFEKFPALKEKFEQKKNNDPEFRKDYYAQLEFLYKNSPYMEEELNRYPVARILEEVDLPLE